MPHPRTTLLALILPTALGCGGASSGKDGVDGCAPEPEIPYDGVDQDCHGGDLIDVDRDEWIAERSGGHDCDDTNPRVNPVAPEVPYDGIDQDCDGADLVDVDGDGHAGREVGGGDCDDHDSTRHPGAVDTPYDGIDQDCDGADLVDVDGDGQAAAEVGGADCDDAEAAVHQGAWEVPYDGIDQDCDGVDLTDMDHDGYGAVAAGGTDCDDQEATIHPDAVEVAYDRIDQDCDHADLTDADGDGYGALEVGGGDCNDADPSVHPDAPDRAGDGVDQDCNGVDPTDTDHDGYASFAAGGADCDDFDPDVHPAALEVCDSVDNDCDGAVDILDAGLVDGATWYQDRDGDGHGDVATTAFACAPPSGYASDAADCDDTRWWVSPSEPERCASPVDDDCDGSINEEGAEGCDPFFADADADGYGGESRCLCAPEGEYTLTYGGDCDDANPRHFPDAPDVCGDGADSNCDGWDTCDAKLADSPGVILGAEGDFLASAILDVGDVDGDGAADLLLGAQWYGADNVGGAYLMSGPFDSERSVAEATATLEGSDPYTYACGGAAAGDFDGDGVADFALAAPGADPPYSGAAYLLHGPIAGVLALAAADLAVEGDPYEYLGWSVAGPLDLTGDGSVDLLVGDLQYRPRDTAGALLAFDGRSAGRLGPADASLIFYGTGDGLGASIALPGDLDGDGLDDVVVGASSHNVGDLFHAGAVYVLLAPASGVLSTSDADGVHYGTDISGSAGELLKPAGDTDGDGRPELLVGSSQGGDGSGGYVALVRDPLATTSLQDAPWLVAGDTNAPVPGNSAVGNVDMDGDGQVDLAVSVERTGSIADGRGSVATFLSPGTGRHAVYDADLCISGENAGDAAGFPLASAGDVDGDGTDDLYVGANDSDRGATDGGAVYLLLTGSLDW